MLDIALLGTGGMMPLPNRFLTSLLVRCRGKLLLIDCGEATQITMKMLGWGFRALEHICITHFHADHISGLPGLLLMVGNSDRTEPLTIIGPPRIAEVVNKLRVIAPRLPYEIKFIELGEKGTKTPIVINADEELFLSALPLNHGLPCYGYTLDMHRKGKFDVDRAKALDIPIKNWGILQRGDNVTVDGKTYTPDMVLGDVRKGLKVSYITDTRPTRDIPNFVREADLFVCEGLYGDDENYEKAEEHGHMLFSEAAEMAKAGNVAKMWLTHYSPSLPDPQNYVDSARRIFPNSFTCKDRKTETLKFDED